MRRFVANKYVLALLVVIALAAEFGLASISHPAAVAAGPRTPAPARATVSAALRACPAPGSTGATASGLALAAASSGTGQAEVTRLSPVGATAPPAPLHVLTQSGQLSLVNVAPAPALARGVSAQFAAAASASVPTGPARGGVMIQASGSMARGLEAEQTSAGGMATAQCLSPGTDFWFVGPGQKSAADIQLYLMNTDGQAADATVQILTDSGPVLGSTGRRDRGPAARARRAVPGPAAARVAGGRAERDHQRRPCRRRGPGDLKRQPARRLAARRAGPGDEPGAAGPAGHARRAGALHRGTRRDQRRRSR